jgi:hypothetical protein
MRTKRFDVFVALRTNSYRMKKRTRSILISDKKGEKKEKKKKEFCLISLYSTTLTHSRSVTSNRIFVFRYFFFLLFYDIFYTFENIYYKTMLILLLHLCSHVPHGICWWWVIEPFSVYTCIVSVSALNIICLSRSTTVKKSRQYFYYFFYFVSNEESVSLVGKKTTFFTYFTTSSISYANFLVIHHLTSLNLTSKNIFKAYVDTLPDTRFFY